MNKKWRGLLVLVSAMIGGALSRWHGGGFVGGSPKILKAFLWALPFSLCTLFALLQDTKGFVFIAAVTTGVLLWSMVFKNTGHGGGMDLAHSTKEPGAGRTPEKLEYLILWLHGKMPQYYYDLLLLTIIGLFSTAGAAIGVGLVNVAAGAVIALGGLGKPLGYAVGWWVFPEGRGDGPKNFDEATAIGEFLTGVFAFLALGVAAWMVWS